MARYIELVIGRDGDARPRQMRRLVFLSHLLTLRQQETS